MGVRTHAKNVESRVLIWVVATSLELWTSKKGRGDVKAGIASSPELQYRQSW